MFSAVYQELKIKKVNCLFRKQEKNGEKRRKTEFAFCILKNMKKVIDIFKKVYYNK